MSDASLRGMLAAASSSSSKTTNNISANANTPPRNTSEGHLVTVADWKLGVQRSALATNINANLLAAIDMDDNEEDDDDVEIEEAELEDDMLDGDMSDLAEGSFGSEDQDQIHISVAMKPTLDANGEVS
jgi:hypothetical protein